jgi:3',5'-cyclic AMP phosphodiesterase CpdA
MRRLGSAVIGGLLACSIVAPASATPRTTVELTIEDYKDADNLLEYGPGEDYLVIDPHSLVADDFRPPRSGSLLNFLQLSDFQIVDEESPGRVEFLDPSQRAPSSPFSAAYRPQESLTTQVTEAMVRAARNTTSPVTAEQLDLAILTGDNADSQQFNETRWFIDILDGTTGPRPTGAEKIDPNSGIPIPGCEATPGSIYDGVRDNGVTGSPDQGFYEPDESGDQSDGDGYSPLREQNFEETPGRDVTVRDFPNLFEAANHPFEALGLGMPWYTAFGNHDALIQGNSPDAFMGPGTPPALVPGRETANPVYHSIATGCFKPANQGQLDALEDALADGLSEDDVTALEDASVPVVPPDPRRCYLAKDEIDGGGAPTPCSSGGWIQQHMVTTGAPVGHGFAPAVGCPPLAFDPDGLPTDASASCTSYGRPPVADFFNDGYYSFAPRQGLRFVVLDTITDECGLPVCAEGSVDDPQFRWLEAQIDDAQARGEYVIVFAHHSLRTTRFPSIDATEEPLHYGQRVDPENPANPQNPSPAQTLEELYCEHPNVIAQVAGHEHGNHVIHYACKGTTTPPEGPPVPTAVGPGDFWHITTAAHIDWPQQSRMIELIDNGDGATMSLVLTMLDHAGPPNPGLGRETSFDKGQAGEQVLKLASIGREISYNDYQASRAARGEPKDRNVILIVKRPASGPPD